jgi:aminoglycoside phosphotransferase (APT) family kinase protein
VDAVAAWLSGAVVDVHTPLTATLIAGGRSNLSYRVDEPAGGRSWVLRRPPLSGVISSAHDVLREHRIMSALSGSGVPVPAMVAACADESVIGAPFFVMEYVEGAVLHDRRAAETELGESARAACGPALVAALAALHAVDPRTIGLGDLGRGEGYVGRQLSRWREQLDRLGVTVDPTTDAAMQQVHARLSASVPEQVSTTLVHGDFRLGNAIVGTDGSVRAVLDWELATRGDPMADVGWLAAYWGCADRGIELPLPVPTRARGFLPLDDVLAHYERLSGRSLAALDYYVAFALWRLAAIVAGVNTRARTGAYGAAGESVAGPEADERVRRLVAAAETATTAAGR